jgi:Ni2+-binding GTPase involved in maturation of urease and hydrogenase
MLPYTNFSIERITADMRRLAPKAVIFQVSALKHEGTEELANWLERQIRSFKEDPSALASCAKM